MPGVGRFARGTSGATAILFALVLPVMAMATAAALQYTYLVQQRNVLQGAADAAAVGGAKQLSLANSVVGATDAATAIVHAALGSVAAGVTDSVTAAVVDANTGVDVTVVRAMPSFFARLLGNGDLLSVRAHSVAHLVGDTTPICIIGLDPRQKGTISLDTSAVVQAPGCAAYSNSRHPWSITSVANAVLKTALTCAVGGKQGNFPNFSPQPKSGCPAISDPLAARVPPSVGPCTKQNYVASAFVQLAPGVYCGGLTISGPNAAVTLMSGTYIIKDGPLKVTNGGSLTGTNVGFYLTGTGAVLDFEANSTIGLTAPSIGTMAGMLFFEDRTNSAGALHQVLSNNAQTLLGTIYLPQGRFYVGSNAPVAGSSAYTIVVADTVELSAGPTLVLNTNYGATDIPVPAGVGPQSGFIRLTQ